MVVRNGDNEGTRLSRGDRWRHRASSAVVEIKRLDGENQTVHWMAIEGAIGGSEAGEMAIARFRDEFELVKRAA